MTSKLTKGLLIALIILGGVSLRSYNFSDWLHFELDQARDAKVVGLALEDGIGNLPLLGPKAAGSFLRLGPLFYYTEYLSGLFFGNSPVGLSMISLILSCLTLPLFYLFVRRFFDQRISILLLLLFSTSLFLVMYSRFAWNPNNLPFFILGFLYSLLRATDHDENRRGWWLVVASAFFAFASQLHFVAFLALPVIGGIYLLIKRPHIALKFWALAVLMLVFFYIPPIVNDIKTGGENIAEFQKVFLKKSTKDANEHSLGEKAIRGLSETALGYFIVYSGYQKAELPKVQETSMFNFDIVCDQDCRSNLPLGAIAALVSFLGAFFLFANLLPRKETHKRDFLIVTALWFLVTLVLFVPIAYDLAPRFFLLVAPLPFIMIGLMLEFLERKRLMLVGYLLIAILVASNGFMIYQRFSQLAKAPRENFKIESDKILKERNRVTLEQQLLITDYVQGFHNQNNFPVYLNSEPFYQRAFLFHLEQRGIPRDGVGSGEKDLYLHGNYFLIRPANKSPEKIAEKYLENYSIVSSKNFGTLEVVQLAPRTEMVKKIDQVFSPEKKPTSAKGVPVRCRWNEVLGECNTDGTEEDEAEDEQVL